MKKKTVKASIWNMETNLTFDFKQRTSYESEGTN